MITQNLDDIKPHKKTKSRSTTMEENYYDSDPQPNENDQDKDNPKNYYEEFNYHPQYYVYRSMRIKSSGKYSFQLTLDEDPLYCCRISKHQTSPVPIGIGKELATIDNAKYILNSSKDLRHYSLTCDGDEIFTADMEPSDPENSKCPKLITAQWTPKDGKKYSVKSRMPEKLSSCEYVLDFEERFAQPSIKNAIIYDTETDKTLIMYRRLDEWEMNCDAVPEVPDIFVFALLISINLCKF